MICSSCGNQISDTAMFCTQCGVKVLPTQNANPQPAPMDNITSNQGLNFDFSNESSNPTPVTTARYEYKILTQKDKWFSGKFDPANLERAMNAYAQQGWRVITCATADIAGFGTSRQEFITVLEREVK